MSILIELSDSYYLVLLVAEIYLTRFYNWLDIVYYFLIYSFTVSLSRD